MRKILNNKHGQVAESVTWIVATIIIVVTLIVFIFISTTLSKGKILEEVSEGIGGFFLNDDAGKISRLETKTKFAISINENNQEKIKEWIDEK